jgi:hypothetical protein
MTQLWRTQRPKADEYAEYYGRYIEHVPPGDVMQGLETQLADTLALVRGMPESRGEHRYAPGKWTIKEVLGHLADSERVFAYRLMRIARADATPLPGFEQDDYVRNGGFSGRTLADLAQELDFVRRANLVLLASLGDEAMALRGTASNHPVSARALVYIIAGHERHHVKILRSRYLGG